TRFRQWRGGASPRRGGAPPRRRRTATRTASPNAAEEHRVVRVTGHDAQMDVEHVLVGTARPRSRERAALALRRREAMSGNDQAVGPTPRYKPSASATAPTSSSPPTAMPRPS